MAAEKLHALVLLGARNSRMKDYFDLYAIVREAAIDAATLSRAAAATFEKRRTALPDEVPMGLSARPRSASGRHSSRRTGWKRLGWAKW